MAQENTQKSLNLLYSVSRELSASLDLRTVLERVLNLCTRNVGAERGFIVALDENRKPIDSALIINKKTIEHTTQEIKGILDHGLAGWVLRNRQPVLVTDTSQDQRWFRRPDDASSRTGAKSAICIPMLMAGDQLVGVLTVVHPEPNFFKETHLALLQAIADQAAITIFNAQLYQSLQMAQQRYRELFEESIDPVLVTNWKGQILEANRHAVEAFGMNMAELLGESIFDLHHVNWEWLGEKSANLHNNETLTYLSEIRRSESTLIPVEIYIHKVNIEGGEYLQWIIHNISERKNLDKLREDLSAMVYHDLRSPLSNVMASLEMLSGLMPAENADTGAQLIQIALRSTQRVQRLISSLLDINRLENGQPIAHQDTATISDVVQDAIEVVQPNADGKNLFIHNDISDDFPPVWIDRDMIKRVFINLLENAIKFAPSQGNIWIKGYLNEDTLEVSVQDDGPGIPAETRETIFDKYTRFDTEKSRKGIGLGLAFCRLAVQAHGGRIWMDGPDNIGSRFIFTIPAAKVQ